jgi:hypothetical protein
VGGSRFFDAPWTTHRLQRPCHDRFDGEINAFKMHCQHLSTHFKPAVPFVWLGFQDEVVASQGFPAIDKVCLVVWKCSLH